MLQKIDNESKKKYKCMKAQIIIKDKNKLFVKKRIWIDINEFGYLFPKD